VRHQPSNARTRAGDRRQRPWPKTPAENSRRLILVDRRLPNRLGLPANEITLHAAATLDSVGYDKNQLLRLLWRHDEVLDPPDDLSLQSYSLLPGQRAW